MAVCYPGEGDLWNCRKHPSNRRRVGVCAACLRDRLACLCPHCSNVRPCACAASEKAPSFRRSASLTAPFLRFKTSDRLPTKTPSFLAVLRRSSTKRREVLEEEGEFGDGGSRRMETRSVSDWLPGKGKFWHFPSPMKALIRSAAGIGKATNGVV